MVNGRTLVIATWGQPASWREARYVLEDGSEVVEHCTTLPLLLRRYSDSDAVLLVLDSLIDEYLGKLQDGRCSACYDRLRGAVREAANSTNYGELRERVRKFVIEMLRCLEIDGRVTVAVCPAVGRPGGQWAFHSSPRDYEAVSLAELGLNFLDRRYDRVVLDVSHGVNFMPSVALRVAERFAGLLLVAHGDERLVTLEVYNSDPYSRTDSVPELRLNLVAKEQIDSVRVPSHIPSKLISRKGPLEPSLAEMEDGLNNRYRDAVRLPLSALYYPLPLALQYALSQVQDSALDVLKGAFRLWEGNVTVNLARREVRSVFRLNPDAVYALLLVEAVRRRLGRPEYPARLEVLKRSEALYWAINESFYYLISNELKLIEKSLEERKPSRTLRLCELYGEDCESGTPDKRVMIAHAGLQKEFVLLDPSNKQLCYTDDVENLLDRCGLQISQRD